MDDFTTDPTITPDNSTMHDSTGDGTPDLVVTEDAFGSPVVAMDSDNSGIFDSVATDADGDGRLDTVGFDFDEDGIIDRVETTPGTASVSMPPASVIDPNPPTAPVSMPPASVIDPNPPTAPVPMPPASVIDPNPPTGSVPVPPASVIDPNPPTGSVPVPPASVIDPNPPTGVVEFSGLWDNTSPAANGLRLYNWINNPASLPEYAEHFAVQSRLDPQYVERNLDAAVEAGLLSPTDKSAALARFHGIR